MYNGKIQNDDWMDLNFQQNFNDRNNYVQINDFSRIRIGRNSIMNRLNCLNNTIDYDCTNQWHFENKNWKKQHYEETQLSKQYYWLWLVKSIIEFIQIKMQIDILKMINDQWPPTINNANVFFLSKVFYNENKLTSNLI